VHLTADIRDIKQVQAAIHNHRFDVVVDWIAYEAEHVSTDFELFRDKTLQYIFISSASVYQKPPAHLPITEAEPILNPIWEYSQKKIACENYLTEKYNKQQFPVTIVRPSHTYDKTKIPLHGGYTTIDRMLRGKPVIIHGDGTSLWTLTHHRDFARGFIGLIGNPESIGEVYHITSDEILTWNQICEILAEAAGVSPNIIHLPSDFISRYDKKWGDGLLGDKAHCLVFDNNKIKAINPDYNSTISFKEGAKEILSWYQADSSRQVVDFALNTKMEEMIKKYTGAMSI
jgi:nucleoside-diphosphate-sugar epimerase